MGQRLKSQDRIFGFCNIARYGKKFVSTKPDEPLHEHVPGPTHDERTLLNFTVVGQRSSSFFR